MISGEEAKAARKLIGWSQKKLAVEANISAMTVAKLRPVSRSPVGRYAQSTRPLNWPASIEGVAGSRRALPCSRFRYENWNSVTYKVNAGVARC
jgi:transcriptional regulator with XRE-family HTH domain